MKRPLALLWIILAAFVWSASAVRAEDDVVMITSVAPRSVTSGEEVELSIQVAYTLRTQESAAIKVSANTLLPNGYFEIAAAKVQKGSGVVTLQAKVVPRYWSAVVPFGINASLVVLVGDALQVKFVSTDRANLDVKPAKVGGIFPKVEGTYVDGITIISVSPQTFEEGREQEVVVKVKYELLSRDEGQIGISVNDGRPGTRWPIGGVRVTVRKGETEVRAKFVPKKSGGLPIGQVLATLEEYPKGQESTPLAWDEETVEIK